MQPEMIEVESALASAIGYDAEEEEVFIQFRDSGETWAYTPFSAASWAELSAPGTSVGRFWHQRIKRQLSARQVS